MLGDGTYFPPLLPLPPTAEGRTPGAGLTSPPRDLNARVISRGTAWELVASRWGRHGQDEIRTGLAVMEAESHRNSHAVSPNGCCVGIWQLNLAAHRVSRTCAQSPICSTSVAYRIWKDARARGGSGWEPWEAYTNGSYKQFLGGTTIQDASAEPVGIGGTGCGIIPDPICDIVKGAGVLFDRYFWIRVLKVIAGLVALGMGVLMIAREYLPVGKLARAATEVIA